MKRPGVSDAVCLGVLFLSRSSVATRIAAFIQSGT
jgi:hypothetical protein